MATIRRIEAAAGRVSGNALTLVRLQKALEATGVLFIEQDDKHGSGVA